MYGLISEELTVDEKISAKNRREAFAEVADRTSGKAKQTIEAVQAEPASAAELLARIRSEHALPEPQVRALPPDIRQRLRDGGVCPQCVDRAVELVAMVMPATVVERRLEGAVGDG